MLNLHSPPDYGHSLPLLNKKSRRFHTINKKLLSRSKIVDGSTYHNALIHFSSLCLMMYKYPIIVTKAVSSHKEFRTDPY